MLDPMARGVVGLGQRIRERRTALKLSQAELAELMGGKASLEQVSHYEHERRSPGAGALVDLARALRCSTDYLLGVDATLPNLGRPLTPLPSKPAKGVQHSLDTFLKDAEAQGITYATFDGKPYRLRKDGWEPV